MFFGLKQIKNDATGYKGAAFSNYENTLLIMNTLYPHPNPRLRMWVVGESR